MNQHSWLNASVGQDVDTIDDPEPPPIISKGRLFERLRGHALVFVGACFLGSIPLFAQPLHREGIPIPIISAMRIAFSCLLALSMTAWARMNPFAIGKAERKALLFLGTIGSGFTSLLYTASLKYTTIAIAILAVFCTVPITTYVIDKMHRQFRMRHLACFGLICFGFALLCWDKFSCQEGKRLSEHLLGIAFGVCTGICFGTYAPFGKKLIGLQASLILLWAFGIGFLCHLPMLWWMQDPGPPWTRSTVLNLVGLGLFGCFLPYLFIQIGMKSKYVSSMQVSMFFLLEPLISVLIGYHFGETLTAWNTFGVVLVFTSILLYQMPYSKKRSSVKL